MTGRRLSLLVAFVFLAGCSVDTFHHHEQPGEVEVTLALDENGLSIIEALEATEESHSHHHGETVRFRFQPADGESFEGSLPDTRVLRSEFDLEGQVDPQTVIAEAGLFDVRVPEVKGTLELETLEGTTLGSVDFDPGAPVTRQMELMRESDIMTAPGKIVNHGSSSRKVDILFVPEGYRDVEMDNFRRHVDGIVRGLSNYDGYRQYWNGFNIWRQDIRSRSNVIGSNARPHDTAFETASGISGVERCVFFSNARGQRAARQLGRNVGAEVTVVLVNSTQHGGCAQDGVLVLARPRNAVDILAHELGHALFDLADEYETPRPGGYCSTGPNVSSSPTRLPWADMVTTNQLPTPDSARRGTVGAFEGAGYCSQGRYRPTHNCLMRSFSTGFCPVCEREVRRTMARFDLSDNPTQGSNNSGGTSGGSTDSGGTQHQISTPSGLYPDFAEVDEPEISLRWRDTPGASYYNFVVQIQERGAWRDYAEQQVDSTRVRVSLNRTGQFRWRVSGCHSNQCVDSLWARFDYVDGSSGGTDGGTTDNGGTTDPPTSGSLSQPSHVSPSNGSAVGSSQVRLDWSSSSGASHYKLQLQVYNSSAQSWSVVLDQDQIDSSRLTIAQLTDDTWYAWAVQACNLSGCSSWTDPTTFRTNF